MSVEQSPVWMPHLMRALRYCQSPTHPMRQLKQSEWVDSSWHISTIRLYSAMHVGIRWKIQDRRQIKNRHTTKTKYNTEIANNTKYSRTKLAWSSRFLRHSAKKRGGPILQSSQAHTGWLKQRPHDTLTVCRYETESELTVVSQHELISISRQLVDAVINFTDSRR